MTLAPAGADLQEAVEGRVLRPGDDGFAAAARCWNLAVRHEPDVLLEAASAADAAAGVRWAAARQLPIGVQSTGHGALEPMHGGLLISTRLLKDIEVDVAARTARVGAGVQWKDLLPLVVPHGLACLNGSSSDVGVVGYTLGGGLPVLGRAFGYAAERVRRFEVVTPDGRARAVDADHDPDLFAALKGGGGGFGVVTALELGLVPLPAFYGGGILYPGEDADEVLTAFRAWIRDLPDDACPSIVLVRLPADAPVPEAIRGRSLVHLRFAVPRGAEEGDRLLAPMRRVSRPLLDLAGPLPYDRVDLVNLDPVEPVPHDLGGALLTTFDADAQRALLDAVGPDGPLPGLLVELRVLGGALSRPPAGPDAISGRDAAFILEVVGALEPPVADRVPGAIDGLLAALRPWATGGTLVNFHGLPRDAEDAARAWTPEVYAALTRAKRRYDPQHLLRLGHGVRLPLG